MTTSIRPATLGVILLLLAPAGAARADEAAIARDAMFKACDGYEGPSKGADAITRQATILGMAAYPEYTIRAEVHPGAAGVSACTEALSDAQVQAPNMWMRRVSLLMARAMHRLQTGDIAAANADLDLAEQSISDPADPLFQRSLGTGLRFIRATALRLAGDQAGAEALAMTAWSRKPYDGSAAYSALLAIGPAGDPAKILTLSRALAGLEPGRFSARLMDALSGSAWPAQLPRNPAFGANPGAADALTLLFAALPDAEGPERIGKYRRPDPIPVDRRSPFKPGDPARYHMAGDHASAGIVEEMTLLRAAEFARSQGHRAFIVLNSSTRMMMVSITSSGLTMAVNANGFTEGIVIRTVDPANPPPELAPLAWRFVDADAVIAALSPVYLPGRH